MTVYEKLNAARVAFQKRNIKKSGHNKYAGYTYYELSDILPAVNEICEELKATCIVSFDKDYAELLFTDAEKEGAVIRFTSPMATANLKGCHDVQNLGAVESYIKRYLYQNCFEIAEHDVLDGSMNPNGNGQTGSGNTQKKWTGGQVAELKRILESKLPNGTPVFCKDDKDTYNEMFANGIEFTEAIGQAKEQLQNALQKDANQGYF